MNTAAKFRLGGICLGFLILIAGLGGGVSNAAFAQDFDEVQLYYQGFNDGVPDEWVLNPAWDVTSLQGEGVLQGEYSPRTPNWATLQDIELGEQPFRLRYRFLSRLGGFNANLLVAQRQEGISRYAVGVVAEQGLLTLELFRQDGIPPEAADVRNDPVEYDPGQWHWVEIQYNNGQFNVTITPDGTNRPTQRLTYRDPEPLPPGLLGFEVWQGMVYVDDIEIWGPREVMPPQDEFYFFSGQVFGNWADRSEPLGGIQILLFGSNSPYPQQGELLGETFTDSNGNYGFEAPSGFEFYRLHAVAHEGFEPEDASSIYGRVVERDWIEFSYPFEDFSLPENNFYFIPPRDLPPAAEYIISGQVFEGEPGDHRRPLPGVRLEIRGANDPGADEGELLAETISDEAGNFGMPVLAEFEVFRLRAFVPPGFEPAGPPEIEGVEVTPEWIRFTFPLDELVERNNTFFMRRVEGPTVTPREGTGGPPPDDGGGDNGDGDRRGIPPWVWVGGGLVLLGGGLLFFRLLRGPGDPTQPGRPLPPVPGLPPIRLVNLWLTEGAGAKGKFLSPDHTLVAGSSYTLHAQIQSRQNQTRQDARQAEQMGRTIPLEVVFFAPEGDFSVLGRRRVTVTLPPTGSSGDVQIPLQPLESGPARVRVGIYYQNVLIQSAYIDLQVADQPRNQSGAIQRGVDYVAVSRFQLLDQLGSPRLSIFTNQAPDGSHWVGLFSSDKAAPAWLQQGAVHTFAAEKLSGFASHIRSALSAAAGYTRYTMDYDPPPDELSLRDREKDLIDLAVRGRQMFDDLFLSQLDGLPRDQILALLKLLENPGLISIARLRDDNTTFPWAGLYSYELDDAHKSQLEVCSIYKGWIEAAKWHDRGRLIGKPQDLLDDPLACSQQQNCPLAGNRARYTICPFGFWGFLHQVEQPIQLVKPVAANQVPEELKNPAYEVTTHITVDPGEAVRMGVSAYTQIRYAPEHLAWLQGLSDRGVLELKTASGGDETLKMLEQGGQHLLYLFCHGEKEDIQFRFVVGSLTDPGYISANALRWPYVQWTVPPQPLVFLNACKSQVSTPELIHGFLGKFHKLGASGVIGVEIDNFAEFAYLFGELFVEQLLTNRTVGEIFLDIRRTFVRQGNPLGLVYSLHGSANLHLHREPDCPVCAAAPWGTAAREVGLSLPG